MNKENLGQQFNNDIEEGFKKAIKKTKANLDPNYKGDNPKNSEEVIKDLRKIKKIKEKKVKPIKKEKSAPHSFFEHAKIEKDRLVKAMISERNKIKNTKNENEKKAAEEKMKFYSEEFEKAKKSIERLKERPGKRQVENIRENIKNKIKEGLQETVKIAKDGADNVAYQGGAHEDIKKAEIIGKNLTENAQKEAEKTFNYIGDEHLNEFDKKGEERKETIGDLKTSAQLAMKNTEYLIKRESKGKTPEEDIDVDKIITEAETEDLRESHDIPESTPVKYEKTDEEIEKQIEGKQPKKEWVQPDLFPKKEESQLDLFEPAAATAEKPNIEAGVETKKSDQERAAEMEKEITEEAKKVETEIEKTPETEREKIGVGFRNFGFFAKELKSKAMAYIFENAGGDKKEVQEAKGFAGSTKRWLQGWAQSYRKDEALARKNIETTDKVDISLKQLGNVGFITGETVKWGRTAADILGWTVGSPLRYAMLGAQFFSRGAEAAKEARLMNAEVIEKTRIKDIDEAAEEAWKIYKQAKTESEKSDQKEVSKQALEAAYIKNLPQDLLNRLQKSEPGTATGILQKVLKKDLELAINYGKVNEARLKEYDRLISQYGAVDALAMGAKYAETAGKAVIAGVSIETAYLGAQALWNNFPKILHNLENIGKETTGYWKEAIFGAVIKSDGVKIKEIIPEIKPELIDSELPRQIQLGQTQLDRDIFDAETERIKLTGETNNYYDVVKAEAPAPPEAVGYQGGKSIWQEAEKQLSVRFKDQFENLGGGNNNTAEALKTYNIDRIKDTIVNNPQDYGVPKGKDFTELTTEDLKNVNFDKAFADTFPENKGLLESLPQDKINNIVKNNTALKQFFAEHSKAPRTNENYEAILRGQGKTGEPILETLKIEPEKGPIADHYAERMIYGTKEEIPTEKGPIADHYAERMIYGTKEEIPTNVKLNISNEAASIMEKKGIHFKDGHLVGLKQNGKEIAMPFTYGSILNITKPDANHLSLMITNSDGKRFEWIIDADNNAALKE